MKLNESLTLASPPFEVKVHVGPEARVPYVRSSHFSVCNAFPRNYSVQSLRASGDVHYLLTKEPQWKNIAWREAKLNKLTKTNWSEDLFMTYLTVGLRLYENKIIPCEKGFTS